MATIGYYEPRLVGSGSIKEPKKFLVNPAQGAAWRRGDIVVQTTTGTITALNPNGNGALASASAPAASAVTLGTSAVAGAPAATYYGAVTYTATSQESPPYYFIVNCPAGYLPTVNVASAGAPAGATNQATYLGLFPGYLALQQATKTTTALGATFTASNPLTNSTGANRGATNLSGSIIGLADSMSDETYFDGIGGSFTAGRASSRLGATNSVAPLTPTEAPMLYVVGLGFGQLVEMNLNQNTAWSPMLLNTQVGLTLDATTGFFTVDPTQSNKVAVIVDQRPGVYIGPTASGSSGDIGTRVIVEFLPAALAVQ
jgi:hypothetical protein